MAAKFTVQGTNLLIEMDWLGTLESIQRVVQNAAAYLFDKGFGNHGTEEEPRVFADLTPQEWLDIVYNHFTTVAVNALKQR